MTPDEWLLAQFDQRAQTPANHRRQIIQLIDDCPPSSSEEFPIMSGEARWPEPTGDNNLDRRDKMPAQLPARTEVIFAPAVI